MLSSLEASDFIIKYVPFGLPKNKIHYKVIDPFCLFYLHFVKDKETLDIDFWLENIESPSVVAWRGLAFENVCFNHISQIKKALGISGVRTTQSAWSKRGSEDSDGAQIDLLIERKDNIINMCEMKFSSGDFSVSKDYYKTLIARGALLRPHIAKKMSIPNTLITTYGLKQNEYSRVFTSFVTLEDLFD